MFFGGCQPTSKATQWQPVKNASWVPLVAWHCSAISFYVHSFLPVDFTAEGECFAILYLISPLFFWRSLVKILFSLKQEHDERRWRVDANGEQEVERAHVSKYDPCEWMCPVLLFARSYLSFLNYIFVHSLSWRQARTASNKVSLRIARSHQRHEHREKGAAFKRARFAKRCR